MQLLLIFPKTSLKYENFLTFLSLSNVTSFLAIKKTVKEGGGKFILFLSLFLTVHVNF